MKKINSTAAKTSKISPFEIYSQYKSKEFNITAGCMQTYFWRWYRGSWKRSWGFTVFHKVLLYVL